MEFPAGTAGPGSTLHDRSPRPAVLNRRFLPNRPCRAQVAAPVLLLFALPIGAQSPAGAERKAFLPPLTPDVVMEVPGGPLLVHFEAPGTSVASLRLSLRLSESPHEAGAGRILVGAALDRVEPLALRVGARIEGVRSFHGISYTVSGPSAAFDHLAWLLRELVREPEQAGVGRALERLRSTEEGGRETPAGVLDTRLREGIAPGVPPLSGTAASLAGMSFPLVRDLWSRTHTRGGMTVVAAAPVPVEVLLAGILDAGMPDGGGGPPIPATSAGTPSRARSQVLRSWYGEAYRIDTPDDPRSAVAARLMAQRLRSLPGRVEAGVQLWELGGSAALVVTGAAYPGDAAAMRRTIQGIREEVASRSDPLDVRRIIEEIRGETLLGARGNRGLVSVVGYHLDATGDPAGAQTFLDVLAGLDETSVGSYLRELLTKTPVVADVRP